MSQCSAYVFLQEFYSLWPYIQVFNPFLVYFCLWYQEVFQFHYFTCSCPVLPAPLIEEAIFASLYIPASFVKNKVPIGVWVYLWALYLVPLGYISVFVPVLYCHDDYSFVVQSEVRKVDSSALFFFFLIGGKLIYSIVVVLAIH